VSDAGATTHGPRPVRRLPRLAERARAGRAGAADKRLAPLLLQLLAAAGAAMIGLVFGALHYPQAMDLLTTMQWSVQQLQGSGAAGNWYPVRFKQTGVLRYDAARAQNGYTLYAIAPDLSAHLVDLDGRELHQWSVSREAIMPAAARQARTLFGAIKPQIEAGHLFPNGDLLLIYEQAALAPSDSSLIKLDKDSRILWKTQVKVHHAVEVVGNRIYALTHAARPPGAEPNSLVAPDTEESVSILAADGTVLSTHSILDAMANSRTMRLADMAAADATNDRLHANSLDVLDSETARFIPGATAGDVLLSLRNLDMLVVLDPRTDAIVWALRGSWRRQHDVKMLPNGHMLLFDNQGGLLSRGQSRVLEISPDNGAVVWSFAGPDGAPLDSEIRGGAQRLSGGNTLISEATAGRILEVAPDGTVVWEYVSPFLGGAAGRRLTASLGLTVNRYDPSYFFVPRW
jgi:Arylsulfotransferase (ASST)